MTYQSGRHFLQIPGPTNVPDRVLRALSRPTIDHRGPEFAKLALEVMEGNLGSGCDLSVIGNRCLGGRPGEHPFAG